MTPAARIARLSAAFLGSNLARAAIGFGLSFALARGLGAERFGRWILCTAWASTLTSVVDMGFGVLLTRDGARSDAEPGRLLSGALVVRLGLAIPLAALLWVGATAVSSDPETIAGLRIAAVLGITGAAYGCFGALLRSQPRWLPAVLTVETGWLALQLAGAWWISTGARDAGGRGEAVASLMRLAVVIQIAQIATAALAWRTVFGDRGRVGRPSREAVSALARRALPFAASGLVANAQARVGPLLLGALSTPAEVGLFGVASRFGSAARLAPQAVFAGALPVLSHEHGRDRPAAERVFHAFDRALLLASVLAAGACALLAAPLLRFVFGAPFAGAAPALVWVSVGLVPLLSNAGRKVFLYASGGERRVVCWSAIALAVQIGASAALIPAWGSGGAAIGIAIGEALVWWPLRRVRAAQAFSPATGGSPEGLRYERQTSA